MDSEGLTELGSRAGALGLDEGRVDIAPRDEVAPMDGDGGMLGRVLIYASIAVVIAVSIIWNRTRG